MQIFTYSLETLENLSVCIEIFRTQGEDLCTAVIREVKEETGVGDKNTICGLYLSMIFTYV